MTITVRKGIRRFKAISENEIIAVPAPEYPNGTPPRRFDRDKDRKIIAVPAPELPPLQEELAAAQERRNSTPPKLLQSHRIAMDDVLRNPPKVIVDGVIFKGGLTVMAGHSGTGKTWVVMDLAMAIASGQNWLGRKVEKSRVGYIDEEMGDWGWYSRLDMIQRGRLLHYDKSWDILINHFMGIDLRTPEGGAELTYHITSNGLEILFIDSLSGIHQGDENNTKDMTVVMNTLLRISKETGCAIFVLHHVKKSDGDYRGSGLIENKADNLFKMTKDDDDIKIKSEKLRYAKSLKLAATHNWSADEYRLKEVDNAETAQNKKEATKYDWATKSIRLTLSKEGAKSKYGELVKIVSAMNDGSGEPIGTPTAKSSINGMITQKEIVRDKEGFYTLAKSDSE